MTKTEADLTRQHCKEIAGGRLSETDIDRFFSACLASRLDPRRNQIYCIPRGGRSSIETSIDGFRIIAQRSGEYAGQEGPYWCGENGEWVDVWLSKKPPSAAKVGIMRKGFEKPVWAVAHWDEFSAGQMWKKMPALMLAKCAEALGFRKVFPEDLSGIYTAEEMGEAETRPEPKLEISLRTKALSEARKLKEIYPEDEDKIKQNLLDLGAIDTDGKPKDFDDSTARSVLEYVEQARQPKD